MFHLFILFVNWGGFAQGGQTPLLTKGGKSIQVESIQQPPILMEQEFFTQTPQTT